MSELTMCPMCGSENLVHETAKKDFVEIKGEKIDVESKAIVCKDCGESYATFEDEDDLIERARAIYREKAGFFMAKTRTRYHYVTIWLLCKNKKPVKPHK